MAQTSVSRETGEAARDAALAVPGVAGLDGGRVGEVALLLPGTRIEGVRALRRGETPGLEVHIVYNVDSGREITAVADDVRAAVRKATEFNVVDVVVADAVKPADTPAQSGSDAP